MSKSLQIEQDEIESGKNHLSLKREVRTRTLLISEAQANKTRSVRRGANRVKCTWRQRRRSCWINYTWKESKSHESSAYENHLWYCTDQVQCLKLHTQYCLFASLVYLYAFQLDPKVSYFSLRLHRSWYSCTLCIPLTLRISQQRATQI